MEAEIDTVLLVDTCSVYKLYFFKGSIISEKEISVPGLGLLKFHPIVKEEFDALVERINAVKKGEN